MVHTGRSALGSPGREATREYLMEMLVELALLARAANEVGIAILIEAIIAAQRATRTGRSDG